MPPSPQDIDPIVVEVMANAGGGRAPTRGPPKPLAPPNDALDDALMEGRGRGRGQGRAGEGRGGRGQGRGRGRGRGKVTPSTP
eukprot:8361826-Pyramimonas_sp.AAC.1